MSAQLAQIYPFSVPAHIPCSSQSRPVFITNKSTEKALQEVISTLTDSLRDGGLRPVRVNSRPTSHSQIIKIKTGDTTRSVMIETQNGKPDEHQVYYKQRVGLSAMTLGKTTVVHSQHPAVLSSTKDQKALHDDLFNWLSPKIPEPEFRKIQVLSAPTGRVPTDEEVVAVQVRDVRLSVSNGHELMTLYFDTDYEPSSKMTVPLEHFARYDGYDLKGMWFVVNRLGEFDFFTHKRYQALFLEAIAT